MALGPLDTLKVPSYKRTAPTTSQAVTTAAGGYAAVSVASGGGFALVPSYQLPRDAIDPAFRADEVTDVEFDDVKNVLESIPSNNINRDVFSSIKEMLMLHPLQFKEFAKAPFKQKSSMVHALLYKVEEFEKDSVICTTNQTNGSAIGVINGKPEEMETFSRTIISGGATQQVVWPSNLFFFIQLVYALFAGSYFLTPDSRAFDQSFSRVNEIYGNRLRRAIELLQMPLTAKDICIEIMTRLRQCVLDLMISLRFTNDKQARLEQISLKVISSLVFEGVVKAYNDNLIRMQSEDLQAMRIYVTATQAERDHSARLAEEAFESTGLDME